MCSYWYFSWISSFQFLLLLLTFIHISQEANKMVWYSNLCKFSTVCCNPQSQRLLHIWWSRGRRFSAILLLFLWTSRCCQFDLWFFGFFSIQLGHLEFHSACTVEDLLGEITLVACEMSATVWEMYILWTHLSFGLDWIWPFQSCGYCWIFQIC